MERSAAGCKRNGGLRPSARPSDIRGKVYCDEIQCRALNTLSSTATGEGRTRRGGGGPVDFPEKHVMYGAALNEIFMGRRGEGDLGFMWGVCTGEARCWTSNIKHTIIHLSEDFFEMKFLNFVGFAYVYTLKIAILWSFLSYWNLLLGGPLQQPSRAHPFSISNTTYSYPLSGGASTLKSIVNVHIEERNEYRHFVNFNVFITTKHTDYYIIVTIDVVFV